MFAGVAGGIAEYLEVDPTLVRLVFVALTLLGGPGIIIYLVLMLIVPEAPSMKSKRKHVPPAAHDDMSDMVVSSSIPVPDAEDAPGIDYDI